MGRNVTADKTPMLENAEQNIGNSVYLNPQATNNVLSPGTNIPQTNPPRILNLAGGSAAGQTTSIVVTASRILQGTQNPSPGYAGPITGIIEFGNGGRVTRVEFDVPIGPYAGGFATISPSIEPQDGGVIVTVPTSILRVYARYDNLLLANLLGPNNTLAQFSGLNVVGPGGPRFAVPTPRPAEPVLVKASASYFSRHFARAYKTIYCYIGDFAPGGLHPIQLGAIGPPASYNLFCLPAFAQSVQVLRNGATGLPKTAALEVALFDNVQLIDGYSIPAGSSPVIPISGHEVVIGIRSATAAPADNVTFLALACEVGV